MPRDPASIDAEIDSLKVNDEQLAARLRLLEKQMETFVTTHWWKRLWFWIDGWPSTRLAAKRHSRPWHWLLLLGIAMSTQLFPRNTTASIHVGTNNTKLDGSGSGWRAALLSTSRGAGAVAPIANTVAGPTNGIEILSATSAPVEFFSEPLDADVTISGTITVNIWAHESSMSANVAINCIIERVNSVGGIVSTIAQTNRTVELGITDPPTAAQNFTATPTSTNMLKGDRLRVRIYGDDATANMGSGFQFTAWIDGTTAGFNGDTYVQFTETFGFLATTPAGSQLFLTDAAGPAVGAAVEKEMWTSRGNGVNNIEVDTVSGWAAPIQWTDAQGGTVVEWYSKQLQAFTLADLALCNLRVRCTIVGGQSVRAELAVCDNDGSNVTVWGGGNWNTSNGGELSTAEQACQIVLAGDDLAVAGGQRLRLRVFVDDSSDSPMSQPTSNGVLFYDGTSAGASGDSWIQLTQSVSEFAPRSLPRAAITPFQPLLAM